MGNILKFRARVGINGMVEIRIFETICKCCLWGLIVSISLGSVVLCWLADPSLHGGGPHIDQCQHKSRIMSQGGCRITTQTSPGTSWTPPTVTSHDAAREGRGASPDILLVAYQQHRHCGCQDVCFRKVLRISSNYLSSASLIVRYAENHKIQYKSWTLLKATD